MSKLTPEQFAEQMKPIAKYASEIDEEVAHLKADELLMQVLREQGFGEGCDIFDKMDKWYG